MPLPFRGWEVVEGSQGSLFDQLTIMRIASTTLAVLLMLIGGIWFLQGINILPGSFMTGQTKWAVYGGILLVVGLAVLIRARRVGR